MSDTPNSPPGWYPDGSGRQRYWDGNQWTDQMADSTSPALGQTPKKKIPVWAWFVIVPVVGFAVVCFLSLVGIGTAIDSADKKDKAEEQKEAAVLASPPVEADFVVTPDRIVEEFAGNEFKSDQKYKGTWIEVTGIVTKIDTDLNGETYSLDLGKTEDDWSDETVTCNELSKKILKAVDKGQEITVIGMFDDGGDLGVDLKGCHLR